MTHEFIRKSFVGLSIISCVVGISLSQAVAQPLAKLKTKFVGNIIGNGNSIRSDFSKYWNQVTAENAGKWGSVEYNAGVYSWTQLDNIYNYAVNNNFPYKHHTLIWGQQEPYFISSLDSAQQYQEVENWIKETGQRYPLAAMCDVVNEPLHAEPSFKKALGGSGVTGWDWVIKAFELARRYWSPNTKLLINEYNVLNNSSAAANYVKIINLLKDRGLIDGIGIQAHGFEVDGPSVATLKSNLNTITATGLPVYISEFEINQADDNTQLTKYQTIFPALYEDPGVQGITLWGYVQDEMWKVDGYLVTNRKAERPALKWLRTYLLSPFKPLLVSPLATTNESISPKLVWHSSDLATAYNVQVATDRGFASIIIDYTVTDTSLQLDSLSSNTLYFWRVNASNADGTSDFSALSSFITETIVGVENTIKLPDGYSLAQNYPNPFNPSTNITYSIPKENFISLKVYNLLGEEVANIQEGFQQAGSYTVTFNAAELTSGIYFYRLRAGNFVETKKLILMR